MYIFGPQKEEFQFISQYMIIGYWISRHLFLTIAGQTSWKTLYSYRKNSTKILESGKND